MKAIKAKIKPITSDRFNRPAKRPAFSVLGNTILRLKGIKVLRHWDNALKDYLTQGQ